MYSFASVKALSQVSSIAATSSAPFCHEITATRIFGFLCLNLSALEERAASSEVEIISFETSALDVSDSELVSALEAFSVDTSFVCLGAFAASTVVDSFASDLAPFSVVSSDFWEASVLDLLESVSVVVFSCLSLVAFAFDDPCSATKSFPDLLVRCVFMPRPPTSSCTANEPPPGAENWVPKKSSASVEPNRAKPWF